MNADQMMLKEINILRETGVRPKLLLNSCCGPCSTSVLEQLAEIFEVTVHFYNPNIHSGDEYSRRLSAQKQVMKELLIPLEQLLERGWTPEGWQDSLSGIPFDHESGSRCRACIGYRMNETAALAAELSYEWFTTTLSVSPHKDAAAINDMGAALANKYGIRYLMADFKKRGGYQRSVLMAKSFGLYRQDHCGCEESRRIENSSEEMKLKNKTRDEVQG